MAINKRRELEVKFKVGKTLDAVMPFQKLLLEKGFSLHEKRLETDFLPDTPDGQCKQNKLLIRARRITTPLDDKWLLTLKHRVASEKYQDHEEIETYFNNTDLETFEQINAILQSTIHTTLPSSMLTSDNLEAVRANFVEAGLSTVRILLDKYRQEYSKGKLHATLDYFPDGMGAYMELEAYEEHEIEMLMTLLGLDSGNVITDDYGDLLKQHKANLSSDQQRTALFSEAERSSLLGKP